MDYYTGNASLGHYTEPRSRDSTFSQSSDSPSLASVSPSLNQRPRAPPDFTSRDRLHMPNPASGPGANPYAADLVPPTRPFGQGSSSNRSSLTSLGSSTSKAPLGGDGNGSGTTSLSVNYLPSKFSRPHSPGLHPRHASSKKGAQNPIRGGGTAAFGNQARMAGANDDDYDGVQPGNWGSIGGKGHRLRWNKFKWILLVTNTIFTIYSLVALIFCLMTWLKVWDRADVVLVANGVELILSTVAASLGVLTAMIGWAGILLNNRAFLAVFTLLLWAVFGLLVSPGYVTYKRRSFNLEGKTNAQWSRQFGAEGRLRIQNKLECCGYYSPFVEATVSQTCYARSLLPGCKGKMISFEKMVLSRWYTVSFGLVPLQVGAIFAALLCSNHVTYRFGKGMMPKAYRLSLTSMAVIMDNYAQQLAEQYGDEVASDVLLRSRNKMASLGGPGSPTTGSFASGMPAARSTGVNLHQPQPQQGYGIGASAPPSSYPFAGPGSAGRATPPGAGQQRTGSAGGGGGNGGTAERNRNSGYATYGSSAYQMSMLGKGTGGPNEQGGYDDDGRGGGRI